MDENLITLLEELSLRTSAQSNLFVDEDSDNFLAKDPGPRNNYLSSSNYTSSSNVSTPNHDQLTGNGSDEDYELKSAVNSLFQELTPSNQYNQQHLVSTNNDRCEAAKTTDKSDLDRSKLLVALLGNIDLVTCAVKKINQLVSLGKRMEQIYRRYYVDPNIELDLEEINNLITTFSNIYNSESYVREVNVSRVYQAYCKKLIDIYQSRTAALPNQPESLDDNMMCS